MLEEWLAQLGATITGSIHDLGGDGGGLWGYATHGDLRLRYSWTEIHLGWEPSFDRWANSVDWTADLPESLEQLQRVLDEAQRLGAAGDRADARRDFLPLKLSLEESPRSPEGSR